MDYLLTEEQIMVRDLARKIAQEKLKPIVAEYDREEKFCWPIIKLLAEADLFGVYIEEKYGGMGGGILDLCLVTEELSRVCGGVAVSYAASALGTDPIILFGSEAQKKKYLPDIAGGKKLAAFGLTEPNAGSDAGAIETTARREGDYYILNGMKHFITNGGEAEIYTVVAMTDKSKGQRGSSAFIVEKELRGLRSAKKKKNWVFVLRQPVNLFFRIAKSIKIICWEKKAWVLLLL
jgi:Acyl-CoA dehydrogenases